MSAHGLNLHAATAVDGRDRRRLERLCKYLLRPPFSRDSIHRLPDGRVALDLPRKGRSIEMTAEQFLAKLVALVPPPYFNLVPYAGVFHNRHHMRALIVPRLEHAALSPRQLALFDVAGKPVPAAGATSCSSDSARVRWVSCCRPTIRSYNAKRKGRKDARVPGALSSNMRASWPTSAAARAPQRSTLAPLRARVLQTQRHTLAAAIQFYGKACDLDYRPACWAAG